METRKLSDISVSYISLVTKGANKKTIIWKSEKEEDEKAMDIEKSIRIEKTDGEKRMVYGIVYAPDELDSDGDYTDGDEIEKAAHEFMIEGRSAFSVDKQHDYNPEYGYVAESWIVKDSDPLFPEDAGAWAVGIKVVDDETWEQIKKGEITGISMAGNARFERGEKGLNRNEFNKFMSFLKTALGIKKTDREEKDMTEKDVKKIVSEMVEEKTTELEKSISEKIDGITKKMDDGLEKLQKSNVEKQKKIEEEHTETDEKVEKTEERLQSLEKSIDTLSNGLERMANSVIKKSDDTPTDSGNKEKSLFDGVVKV